MERELCDINIELANSHQEFSSALGMMKEGMERMHCSTLAQDEYIDNTGGKGVLTQWVHGEVIVSFEKNCPLNAHWVHGEYFLKVPTKVPTRCFVKETLEFFHNSLPKVPSRYFVKEATGFFHN